jgi:hypothetical protein
MISKKVAMKAAEKSRFGKLVAYLLDPQGKKTRVGEVSITNCVSTDTTWAVRENHSASVGGDVRDGGSENDRMQSGICL